MRFYWRRLRPGELDHELLWLAVSVASAGLGAAWFALHLPWPTCNFRALFGIPCFTCGSTRAAIAVFHGDVAAALAWNPLATATMLALACFDLYAFAVLISGAPRLRVNFGRTKPWLVAFLFTTAGVNWLYLLSRY